VAKNEKPKAEASKPEAAKGDAQQPAEQAAAKSGKSGMLKYILFGVGGLGLLAVAMVVTFMLMGGKKKEAEKPEAASTTKELAEKIKENAKVGEHQQDTGSVDQNESKELAAGGSSIPEDSLQAMADSLDEIQQLVQNINVMNEAADSANALTPDGTSKEDSIKAMTWLDKEKANLAKRESDLAVREKQITELDRKVSQKVLKLEQASSDRVANLAKLYDGMEPDAVAKLIANLDDSLVVSIIPRMKQKNASLLLSNMPPQRAATLSKQIITLAGE
jgi:flagellar motility protein MotE (MotC chaperone)